jgi:hypothetical protein
MFPRTYPFLDFILKCQANYLSGKRAIASPTGEILFTVTHDTIEQMIHIPQSESTTPFSIESLNELYQKLNFLQIAQIFEIFLLEDAQLPKKNPLYLSTIFIVKANKIISMLSYILGYYSYEWVD